jgi:hypothetical protein
LGLLSIARRRTGAPEVTTRIRPWSVRRNGEPESQEWTGGDLPAPTDEPLGRLIVTGGPQQGSAVEVGSRPRRIGSAPYCDLVLADDDGTIAPEEARVWVSEGRLLYHKLTRLTTFASDGPIGGWFVLADRDEMRVGPHRLVFELLPQKDVYAEALSVVGEEKAEQAVRLTPSEKAEQPAAVPDEDIPWRQAGEAPTDHEDTPAAVDEDIPWRHPRESSTDDEDTTAAVEEDIPWRHPRESSTDDDGETPAAAEEGIPWRHAGEAPTDNEETPAAVEEDIPWRHAGESPTDNAEEPSELPRRGSGSRRRRGKKESTASQAAAWLRGEEQHPIDPQAPDDADPDDEDE